MYFCDSNCIMLFIFTLFYAPPKCYLIHVFLWYYLYMFLCTVCWTFCGYRTLNKYYYYYSPKIRMFMFVTLSCHLMFMIDCRCFIVKACSFSHCALSFTYISVHCPWLLSTEWSEQYDRSVAFHFHSYGHIVVAPESFTKMTKRHADLWHSLV